MVTTVDDLVLGPHMEDGGAKLDQVSGNTCIATSLGHTFDFRDVDGMVFSLDDIATALSNTCRYGGHVSRFYSVAEHAWRVSELLADDGEDVVTRLLGLHHDDAEAYIGDFPSPLKKLITIDGVPVKQYEDRVFRNIVGHMGLIDDQFDIRMKKVSDADYRVYLMERDERPYPSSSGNRYPMTPVVAKNMFLLRHERLTQEL